MDSELPNGWGWTNIEEVAEVTDYVANGSFASLKANVIYSKEPNHAILVRLADFSAGWRGDYVYVSKQAYDFLAKSSLRPGDIVICNVGSVGATFRVPDLGMPMTLGPNSILVKPRHSADFLFNYFLSPQGQKQIAAISTGSTLPKFNKTAFRELRLPIAPFAEQQRIVAGIEQQFTRLDAGVAALKSAQTRLKRYRTAVLKAAVEGKLTEAWRAEHPETEPASVLLERILAERRARWEADLRAKGKDPARVRYEEPAAPDMTDLPALPDGWCWVTAEQLSDETRAITYGVIKLGDPIEGGIPTLRSSNIRHLRLELDGLKSISPSIATEYQRTFLQGGEILITVRGTLGGVVAVPANLAGFNISREVAMIALVQPDLAEGVALFIGSPPIQNWLMRNTRGIAYTGINIETLKQLPVPFAPLAEQEQIVQEVERRLSVVSELETTLEANLKRAERLRQSILREAFAGRLVPQDPDDEPASVLLERIRQGRETNGLATKQEQKRVPVLIPERVESVEAAQVSLWDEDT